MNQKDADVSLNQENGLALLPFLVFIVIYLGAGLIMQSRGVEMAFYQFPSVVAISIAVLVAFLINRGSINEKFSIFAKGAGGRGNHDDADDFPAGGSLFLDSRGDGRRGRHC